MILLEIVLAIAIMAIILAVLVPQFRIIQNSWDTKVGASETLQNGRELIDHLNRNLSKATRITAVSGPSETNGYIEFIDNDANNVRYDIGVNNYVEFGLAGNLYDLVGPVSQLLFTCYDGIDFTTPTTDVNSIRFIKMQTTLTNPGTLEQDMTFSTSVYIRTNTLPSPPTISKLSEPWLEFGNINGLEPALCQIDQNHYLCAYSGIEDKGWAVVLTVNPDTWNVSKETPFVYDDIGALRPALAKIDPTHYLCAFNSINNHGLSIVLTVDPVTWNVGKKTIFKYDNILSIRPVLAQIDATHYLCTYTGLQDDGIAIVLTVDTGTWKVSRETLFVFDNQQSIGPVLAQIDPKHYLCVYTGPLNHGVAVVLTVDSGTWYISKGKHFVYDDIGALRPALAKIDSTHYLCVFNSLNDHGFAIVLTVDTNTWDIGKETLFVYDNIFCIRPTLIQIDLAHYLCAYSGLYQDGVAVALTVDISTWKVSKEKHFVFDNQRSIRPVIVQIDQQHYLCAYSGSGNDGYAGILNVGEEIRP